MKHGKWFCAILALVTLLTLAAPALARGEIWQKGDTGEKVLEIQARLKELGYLEDETPGAFDEKTESAIRELTLQQEEVLHIDRMMTRQFGNRIYVEMEISVDGDMPLRQAHAVAEEVHDRIEKAFPEVKHIMIHVNPSGDHS